MGLNGFRFGLRALLLLLLTCAQALPAQLPREADIEAAYLFNFAKFLHAPARDPAAFNIGVMGSNPFGGTLEQITANEQIDGRPIHIVQLNSPQLNNPDKVRVCDMIFLSETDPVRLQKAIDGLQGTGVLTVSNSPGFLDRGGMIQFVIASNRVRFAVNLDAVSRAHLSLSSELLKVAVSVSGSPAQEVRQ